MFLIMHAIRLGFNKIVDLTAGSQATGHLYVTWIMIPVAFTIHIIVLRHSLRGVWRNWQPRKNGQPNG
jgi:hypothetical protein